VSSHRLGSTSGLAAPDCLAHNLPFAVVRRQATFAYIRSRPGAGDCGWRLRGQAAAARPAADELRVCVERGSYRMAEYDPGAIKGCSRPMPTRRQALRHLAL